MCLGSPRMQGGLSLHQPFSVATAWFIVTLGHLMILTVVLYIIVKAECVCVAMKVKRRRNERDRERERRGREINPVSTFLLWWRWLSNNTSTVSPRFTHEIWKVPLYTSFTLYQLFRAQGWMGWSLKVTEGEGIGEVKDKSFFEECICGCSCDSNAPGCHKATGQSFLSTYQSVWQNLTFNVLIHF